MRADDAALVEQRQPARDFEHALDDEHHVGPPGVVFVEAQSDIVLQRPGQDAVAEFGDLLAVLEHDRVLADEIDARDVAVEIDAHQRPVEPRGDLLDMRRLAGAVIARDHDAAVEGEAGENRERGVAVEQVVGIEIRHMLVGRRIGGRLHVRVDAEHLAHGDLRIGWAGDGRGSIRTARCAGSAFMGPPDPAASGARAKCTYTNIPPLGERPMPASMKIFRDWAAVLRSRVRPACSTSGNYRPG